MNKKILSIILPCGILFLYSCTKNVDSGKLNTDNEISVFYSDLSTSFDKSVKEMLETEFSAAGRRFSSYDAAGDSLMQENQIKEAISKGTDLLIVNIADTKSESSALSAINLAREEKIPVIFFGNEVGDELITSYEKCVYVADDKASAAKLQGEMIGKYLVENFDSADTNKDGAISYVLLRNQTETGDTEAYAAIGECNSILESKGYGKLKTYESESGFFSKGENIGFFDAAKDYIASLFSENPESDTETIELIIAENDSLALGATAALKDSGFNSGDTGMMIPVFGIEATEEAKASILEGSISGTLQPDAFETAAVIRTVAENYKNGKDKFDSISSDSIIGTAKIVVPYSMYSGFVS